MDVPVYPTTPLSGGELRIYNAYRRPIGTLFPVRAENLSWMDNEVGAATFMTPAFGSRWGEAYLRQWNRVEYHHTLLAGRPWIGIIAQLADQGAEAQLTCASAEILYSKRIGEEYWAGNGTETAGQVINILHNMALKRQSMGITTVPFGVDTRGPSYYQEYILPKISDAFKAICDATGGSWWVDKVGTLHTDPWVLHFARQRGLDWSGSIVVSGEVVDEPEYNTTGADMETAVWTVGSDSSGSGGNIYDRIKMYRPYRDAIAAYGLLEGILDLPDVYDLSLLEESSTRHLVASGLPKKTVAINVDNRRNVFNTFWIGDVIRAILPNVDFLGFDGSVRVKGIQLSSDDGKLGLVVELLS